MRIPIALPENDRLPFDVVGFGLNSVDLLALVDAHPARNTKQQVQRFAREPGGQAATAMVACARLGWRAGYIGRFGDDENGVFGLESLLNARVDVSACVTVPGVATQFAVIVVDGETGDRTVMWDREAGLHWDPTAVPPGVCSGRVLLVDCHETAASTHAARRARAEGHPVVIDVEKVRPGIDALLREIDVVIAAEEFPSRLTGIGETGRALSMMARDLRAPVLCVTLGREGSLALVQGHEIRTPGFDVPVVDTTGAGDVFRGGFIAGWLAQGADARLEDVMTYANAVAALSCRALGARAGIPTADEVELLAHPRFNLPPPPGV